MTSAIAQTAGSELPTLEAAVEGRYVIERELGRGAMGIVYLARDVALERPVAIKLLPPPLAAQPEFRDRFLRESRTVAGLFHPNIVPIYSVEEHGAVVFYVMGFVDGETLTARVARVGALPPAEVSRILQEAGWALAQAHSKGIIHRDVKPDNLLLERVTGRTLLTDFGIARVANSTMTAIGTSLGTPQFMSPEQAAGDATDARSDIYSLGLVGFHALAGHPPFEAPTLQAIMAMQVTKPAPPVASIRPGIPTQLASAIDRCLAKDPAARWPTADAFAAALHGESAGAQIAPPVRNFQRIGEASVVQLITIVAMLPLFLLAQPQRPGFFLVWLGMVPAMVMLQLVTRARMLLGQGFTYDDVRAAIGADLQQREGEARALEGTLSTRHALRGRVLFMSMIILGGACIGAGMQFVTMIRHRTPLRIAIGSALLLLGAVSLVSAFLRQGQFMGRLDNRSARTAARLWRGWPGRAVFALARRLAGQTTTAPGQPRA